jgi:hypothetical protein
MIFSYISCRLLLGTVGYSASKTCYVIEILPTSSGRPLYALAVVFRVPPHIQILPDSRPFPFWEG